MLAVAAVSGDSGDREWLVEKRYRAVLDVLDGSPVGPNRGGQRAHVWVDEYTVHVLIDGELVKTMSSNLTAEDLRDLSMRGAHQAGPPPATPSVARAVTSRPPP